MSDLSVLQPNNEPGNYYIVSGANAIAGPFASFDAAYAEKLARESEMYGLFGVAAGIRMIEANRG